MRLGQRESAREKRFLASELRLRVEQPYRLFINRPVGSANSRPVHHLRMWWERLQQGPVAPSLAEPIQAALAHTTALVTRCSEVAAPTRRLVGSSINRRTLDRYAAGCRVTNNTPPIQQHLAAHAALRHRSDAAARTIARRSFLWPENIFLAVLFASRRARAAMAENGPRCREIVARTCSAQPSPRVSSTCFLLCVLVMSMSGAPKPIAPGGRSHRSGLQASAAACCYHL